MTSRWPLAAWVMAGLLAVIAMALPTIPDSESARIEADRSMVGAGSLDFDGGSIGNGHDEGDQNPGRRLPANVLSPSNRTATTDVASVSSPIDGVTTAQGPPVHAGEHPPTTPSTSHTTSGEGSGTTSSRAPTGETDDGDLEDVERDESVTDTGGPFTEIYSNNFSSGRLDENGWELDDAPGPTGWGLMRPSAISVVADDQASGGYILQVTAAMGTAADSAHIVSGSMQLIGFGQVHGRYSARIRVDADPDRVTSGVLQLTPAGTDRSRGPAIGLFETWANRSTRTPVESYLHLTDDGGTSFIPRTHSGISGTDWHVYTLEWRDDYVAVSVDDRPSQVLSNDPDVIPRSVLNPTIRLDIHDAPDTPGREPVLSKSIRLQIDWIKVEANQ